MEGKKMKTGQEGQTRETKAKKFEEDDFYSGDLLSV